MKFDKEIINKFIKKILLSFNAKCLHLMHIDLTKRKTSPATIFGTHVNYLEPSWIETRAFTRKV